MRMIRLLAVAAALALGITAPASAARYELRGVVICDMATYQSLATTSCSTPRMWKTGNVVVLYRNTLDRVFGNPEAGVKSRRVKAGRTIKLADTTCKFAHYSVTCENTLGIGFKLGPGLYREFDKGIQT